MSDIDPDAVREQVRKRYAGIAGTGEACCAKSRCCDQDPLGKPDTSARIGLRRESPIGVDAADAEGSYSAVGHRSQRKGMP